MGGKVLVPTAQHVRALIAARLAADVGRVPILVVARTDANSANLLTSDIDRPIARCTGAHRRGLLRGEAGLDQAIARGWQCAPMPTCSGARPRTPISMRRRGSPRPSMPSSQQDARLQLLAVNWRRHLDDDEIARFRRSRAQWVQVPVHHPRRVPRPQLVDVRVGHRVQLGMPAYVRLQERVFLEPARYTATRHQRGGRAGYFDQVATVIATGKASTLALAGSTEEEQFRTG